MTTSKIFIVIILLALSFFKLEAQSPEKQAITGQILDATTQKPIPHVEVFISGTTIGCISDNHGNFTLKVSYIPCTLVVDHVAYESFVTPIGTQTDSMQISLNPANLFIDEVKVSGKSNRKKNLRFFYSHFVKKNKNKFEILNDSVLYFKSDKKEFIAYTNEPLIIINKLLGYKTKLTIKRFRVIRTERPNGPKLKLNSSIGTCNLEILSHSFYEKLKTNSLREILTYEKNRRLHYFGSDRHFLKSIYHNNSNHQGFQLEIFPKNNNLKGISKVENFDSGFAGKNFIVDCDSIKVTYKFGKDRYPYNYSLIDKSTSLNFEVSTIYRSNNFFTLRANGTSPNLSFTIVGPMTSANNLVNSLPMDYDPFNYNPLE